MQFLFIATCVFSVCQDAISQVYPVTNLSVKEGLINSNVYAITQDKLGYTWFGTENGLSRYDGVDFENYSQFDLEINSHINSLWPSQDGTLFFGCGINGIYHFDPVTGKAIRINKEPVSQSSQIIVKGDTLISLHEYHSYEFLSLRTGKLISREKISKASYNNRPLSMALLQNGEVLFGRQDGLYYLSEGVQKKMKIAGFDDHPVYSISELPGGIIIIGSEGSLLEISGTQVLKIIHNFKGEETRVRNIIRDKNNRTWYNTWGTNEIFTLDDHHKTNVSSYLSINTGAITKIFKDRDGNIWIGTLGKGVYLFSNMHFTNYFFSREIPNSNIRKIIPTDSHNLLMGTNDGIALFDKKKQDLIFEKQMVVMTQYVRDITPTVDGNFVAAITDIRLKKPFSKAYKFAGYPFNITYTHGSSLLADSLFLQVGNWDNCIVKYDSEYNPIDKMNDVFPGGETKLRINTQFKDNFGRTWIGSQKGFCILSKDGKKFFPVSEFQQFEIYKITAIDGHKIMIVSNKGIAVVQNSMDESKINETWALKIDNTTCAVQVNPGEYLVGTQYGLHYNNNSVKKLFTIHDGLLSDIINDIYHESGSSSAWLATPEGLIALDLVMMKKSLQQTPPAVAAIINTSKRKFIPGAVTNFDYEKSAFRIKFNSFHYANPRLISYQFKVDDGQWVYAPSRELQYASMEPGEHLILIRAGFPDGAWGQPSEIKINVTPPFYRTYWFYFLTGVATCFLIFFFIKKQVKLAREKQEEKAAIQQKLVEYQQKALASNLNPHFIFNSLNSIQHFINANNTADANDYLAKFSRLMRMHLNMADKSYISLAEEIKRLEFYLSLEQMRFGSRLNWNIELSPEIDAYNLEIPNMIIQPFVENAIWHGIMPSENQGHISVSIQQPGVGIIVITVSDNGVGYGKNKVNGKEGHESKGVKLIANRLKLLNPDALYVLEFLEGNPGTIVKIKLSGKMVNLRHKEPLPQ